MYQTSTYCLSKHKLQVTPTASASEVIVLVDGSKTSPAQVAEGQDQLGH